MFLLFYLCVLLSKLNMFKLKFKSSEIECMKHDKNKNVIKFYVF